MRKVLIDTDTGSDDAVALVMALRDPSIEVVAFTTVSGNVEVRQSTYNCLQTIDYAERYHPSVYMGCAKPLYHEHISADGVHGIDGMGDLGTLSPPTGKAENEHAVDALIRYASQGNVEILALGPLTNLAVAMMKAPEEMKKVPHITLMGGAYTKGNTGHLAEFNLWEDAQAADFVFRFGVPITMVTIEACRDEAKITEADVEYLKSKGSRCADFCVDCNRTLYEGSAAFGERYFTLPDAAAAAVLTRPDLISESFESYTRIETEGEHTYGATVNDGRPRDQREFISKGTVLHPYNCLVVHKLQAEEFKRYMFDLIV